MSTSLRIVPAAALTETSVANTVHSEFGVHDSFRHGVRSLASEIGSTNKQPLEHHIANYDETHFELRMQLARNTFGLHAPIKIQMERSLVSRPLRLPALPSSHFSRDILSGRSETIDFEDFLNAPQMSTESVDVHASMEHQLGMNL